MKASFIIGFHTARIDNVLQTLRFLTQESLVNECELLTICQNSLDQLKTSEILQFDEFSLKFKQARHFDLNLPCMKLSKVTNFGVEKSGCDKLIILESDRILPVGYFQSVITQLEQGMQITTAKMFRLTHPADDFMIDTKQFDYVEELRSPDNHLGQRNMWSGNTAIMKTDFYKAGKMDENYLGYGWADSDMTYATEAAGIKSVYRTEIELHLWHEPATYGQGDQKKMFIDNGLRFCRKWNKPIPEWLRADMVQYREELL